MARVLIIEDDRQVVDEIRDLLEFHGYETEVALNGQVAAGILEERLMNIAIMGVKVQDQDGTAILKKLRELEPGILVLMVSERKSKRLQSTLKKAGADGILFKPVNKETLLEKVEGLINSRKPAERKSPPLHSRTK